MIASDTTRGLSTDSWGSIRNVRVLCIGNGGLVLRDGQLWNLRFLRDFLSEMGGLVREICFCGWLLEPGEDPLAQTVLRDIAGVRAVGLPPVRGSNFKKVANGICSVRLLIREVSRSDFVYLFWPGRLSSIVARWCRIIGKPYGIYFRGEQTGFDSTFNAAFKCSRFTLTAGQTLLAVAKAHCRDVEAVTPMMLLRTEHVGSWPRPIRANGPWRLLYVGRIEESKGSKDLLAALAYLEKWGLSFMLTMVGHCQNQDEFLSPLPPSIRHCIRMPGVICDFEMLAAKYREADLFVFPSHEEGFPRVLYEAMVFGVPILTTFVGGIPGVMKDQENCLRIDVRNPRDIADRIRDLVANPKLQAQIAARAHQCVSELILAWKRSHAIQIAERLRDYFSSRV